MDDLLGRLQGDYLYAFLAGTFFLALFARERLNLRVEDSAGSVRQKRFIDMLEPSKLSRTMIFLRGWITYFLLLFIFYALTCAVADPLLTVFFQKDLSVIGFGAIDTEGPAVPLFVSLVMTGFLPRFPLISRMEEMARRMTLRVVGIPESFNDLADAMFMEDLDDSGLSDAERAEIDEAMAQATTALRDSALDARRLRRALVKIRAFRSWMGAHEAWPDTNARDQFSAIAAAVEDGARAVEDDVRDLVERSRAEAAPGALSARWRQIALRADATADDVCALIAIYSENCRALPGAATGAATGAAADLHAARQQALRRFIRLARRRRDSSQVQFIWLVFNLAIVCGLMFVVGLVGGGLGFLSYRGIEGEGWERAAPTGFAWLIGTIATYAPAVMIGWGLRLRMDAQGRWMDDLLDPETSNFLTAIRLYGRMFVYGYLVSVVCLMTLFFTQAYFNAADPTLAWTKFMVAGSWLGPLCYGFLGAVYTVFMVRFFDVREATQRARSRGAWINRAVRISIGLTLGLTAVSAAASALFFLPTLADPGDPEAWLAMAATIAYQAFAAFVFALVTSVGTVLALRSLDGADDRRRAIRSQREAGPVLAPVLAPVAA